MHLSHRLERGRSPVYCFGPGPYHLPGRQPNSACRSADHLLPGSLLLHSSCRGLVAFVGEKGAQALHFGRRNGSPLPVLRSQGTHNICIYIYIHTDIYIYYYIHILFTYAYVRHTPCQTWFMCVYIYISLYHIKYAGCIPNMNFAGEVSAYENT